MEKEVLNSLSVDSFLAGLKGIIRTGGYKTVKFSVECSDKEAPPNSQQLEEIKNVSTRNSKRKQAKKWKEYRIKCKSCNTESFMSTEVIVLCYECFKKITSTNTLRASDEICSNSYCDYCDKDRANHDNCYHGDEFVGRKLYT